MKNSIIINEEYIQDEAFAILDQELSPNEYDDVEKAIRDSLTEFIWDKIHQVIDFNKILKRNRGAEKKTPRYEVYWRNRNIYKPKFEKVSTFKNEGDAREFVHHDLITQFDEWRIILIDKNNIKKEVYTVNVHNKDEKSK